MSREAEQSVLGGLMLDNDKWPEVSNILTANDFLEDARHNLIFESIATLAEKSTCLDPVTLADHLFQSKLLDTVGGGSYLGLLAANTPSVANILVYARIVRRISLERQKKAAHDRQAPSEEIARLELALKQVKLGTNNDLFGEIAQTFKALETEEFEPLTWIVEDLLPAGVTMLLAKPKKGKSWLALDLSMAVANGGDALGCKKTTKGDILYFALEDNDRRMNDRLKKLIDNRFENAPANAHLITANRLNVIPRLGEGFEEKLDIYLAKRPEINLVVVDPFTFIETPPKRGSMRGYLEDYTVISKLTSLVRSKYPNIAVLLVYHMRKEISKELVDTVMGTTGIAGAVDNLMFVKRENNQNEAALFITGKDVKETEFKMQFDKTTFCWQLLNIIDVFGDFIDECCILDPNARVKTGELYACYENWCDENDENALSNANFGKQIKERGISKIKSHGIGLYLGLSIIGDQGDQGDQQNIINEICVGSTSNSAGPPGPPGPQILQADDYLDIFKNSQGTAPDLDVPPSNELITRLINAFDGNIYKSYDNLQKFLTDNELDELVMIGILEPCDNDRLQLCL